MTATTQAPRPLFFADASTPDAELDALVEDLMTYHPWGADQIAAGTCVRDALSTAIKAVIKYVPSSPRRTIALQHLVDARLSANAAITFKGKY